MTDKKGIIIHGSSRSDGDTMASAEYLSSLSHYPIIDLGPLVINHFDYNFSHDDDDFLSTMEEVLQYDVLIFATPVYWYSMSGRMKVFLDRFTDLLNHKKSMGHALKGKEMALISSSSEEKLNADFNQAFKLSADYLQMKFIGHAHTWMENDTHSPQAKRNLEELFQDCKND